MRNVRYAAACGRIITIRQQTADLNLFRIISVKLNKYKRCHRKICDGFLFKISGLIEGIVIMLRIETTDNVCLISINTTSESRIVMNSLDSMLEESGIRTVYISGGEALGSRNKIIIAIDGDDLFKFMKIMGTLKSQAEIKNYSINCSNCMIKWSGGKKNNTRALSKADFDLKLVVISENDGICFCDSTYGKNLHSILNSCSLN